jgi:hypothetical protein
VATKNLNMKFTDEDWEILATLRDVYALDQTNLVRNALRHVLKTRPTFEIEPQRGKFVVPAAEVALCPAMN